MNNRLFYRKIIYIACIGGLIIPLSFISLPPTRNESGNVDNAGGVISQMREEYDLSQAKLAEIDPASETMKLASLGLRGVAVNILWLQVDEHRKNQNYDQLNATLKALTKIQPSFVKVWEYQAHNLAYNVSMEFDDYEYRYSWVKKGLEFLKQGVPYNRRDHRVTDSIGFFTGNKFGKSDERESFRRLFRADDEFRQAMSDRIDPEDYNSPYGHDSWLMAYEWYDLSRDLVEVQGCPQYRSDIMFYMFRPSQLRNQGLALQDEFPSDQIIQEVFRDANDEWLDYGNQTLNNTLGVSFTLEGLAAAQDKLREYRNQLDELVGPEIRASMVAELGDVFLGEEEKLLLKTPVDQLTPDNARRVQQIKMALEERDQRLDGKIARSSKEEDRQEANRIAFKIEKVKREINTITQDSQTINYQYWRTRNKIESEDATVFAHQALEEAERVWKESIYDDEFDFDYASKTKKVTKKGAITLFEEAFAMWAPILESNPKLYEGQLGDRLIKSAQEYQKMLNFANREWPDNFPLQKLIDIRFTDGQRDGLPPTAYLEQRRADRESMQDDDADNSDAGKAEDEPKVDGKPDAAEAEAGGQEPTGESESGDNGQ